MTRWLSNILSRFLGTAALHIQSNNYPVRNIAKTLSRQILSGILQVAILAMVANKVGPDGVASYSLSLFVPNLLLLILNMGLPSAIAYYLVSGPIRADQIWAASRDFAVTLSLVGLVVGTVAITLFGQLAFPGISSTTLYAGLLLLPGYMFSGIITSMFQGIEDFNGYNIATVFQPILTFFFALALICAGIFSVNSLLFANFAAFTISIAVALSLLSRYVKVFSFFQLRWDFYAQIFTYSRTAYFGNIVAFLQYRLSIVIVNLFGGPSIAGLFALILQLSEYMWLLTSAVNTVLFPKFAKLGGTQRERLRFAERCSLFVGILTALMGAIIALLAPFAFPIIFGDRFSNASTMLIALLPSIVLFSFSKVLANYSAARGDVELNLRLALVGLVVSTCLLVALVPQAGIWGAIISLTCVYATDLSIRIFLFKKTARSWFEG
jgi:O-antigen/teichoic acid export membrane protein